MRNEETFKKELESVINRNSIDNELNVPDFILANYLIDCLYKFAKINEDNAKWHGFDTDYKKIQARFSQ